MLRRPPTAISLSLQDVDDYMQKRKQEAEVEEAAVELYYGRGTIVRPCEDVSCDDASYYRRLKEEHDIDWDVMSIVSPRSQECAGQESVVSPLSDLANGRYDVEGLHHNIESLSRSQPDESAEQMSYESDSSLEPPPTMTDFQLVTERLHEHKSISERQRIVALPSEQTRSPSTSSQLSEQRLRTVERTFISASEPFSTSTATPSLPLCTEHGLLLSQPPRRQMRYRARSISYSFEESERASLAYDQSYADTDADSVTSLSYRHRPSLHDELQGTSLSGSQTPSDAESDVDSPTPVLERSGLLDRDNAVASAVEAIALGQHQLSTSLLPPPFSSVSRDLTPTHNNRLHGASSVPSRMTDGDGAASTTPSRARAAGSMMSHSRTSGFMRTITRPFRLSSWPSPSRILTDLPLPRFGELPIPPGDTSQSQLTPRAYQRFVVYHDGLSEASQPQTPRDTPEYWHQGRYHPHTVAPVRRQHRIYTPTGVSYSVSRSPLPAMNQYRRASYDMENEDEQMLFQRAARELWAESSARQGERGVTDWEESTPEPELTSVMMERSTRHSG